MAAASKKNFVLRLDEEAFSALEKWAADEFRSVNGQLEWIIDQALRQAARGPKQKTGREAKKNEADRKKNTG